MTSKIYYVEHFVGPKEDDYIEYEYEVEVDSWEPYDPGVCSGPIERCYPPEGGWVELCEDTIKRRRTVPEGEKPGPWEEVPYSIFMEGYAEGFTDDPPDKRYRKTKWEKARDQLQEEMYEACEEQREADYEAAMEAKYDQMKDDGLL